MLNLTKTAKKNDSKPQHRIVVFLLILTLVIFPKGGMKLFSIPITWGYILTLLVSIVAFLSIQINPNKNLLNKPRALALLSLMPLQAICIISLFLNGFSDVGFAISLVINILVLPILYIAVLGMYIDNMKFDFFLKVIKISILIVSLYGLFLFFFKLTAGYLIEIPFLTVNYGDLGQVSEKNIDRGDGVFKLISTYNNGNIYGVCLLMLLPLYSILERNIIKKSIVKMSLVLTLSRTVWFGLILHEIIYRAYVSKVSLKSIFYFLASTALVVLGIFQMLSLIGANIDFLFDSTLGGRDNQLDYLSDLHLISYSIYESIGEVVYISIAKFFGILGLAFYMIGMLMPIIISSSRKFKLNQSEKSLEAKRSVVAGLLIYMCVSISDGAFLLIPVMSFYWFLSSLALSRNFRLD